MEDELKRLHQFLPPEIVLLVGGHAMPASGEIPARTGAVAIEDLQNLDSTLDGLR